jgi:hypothetical protein
VSDQGSPPVTGAADNSAMLDALTPDIKVASTDRTSTVPASIVTCAVVYLVLLLALFVTYTVWKAFRLDIPTKLGVLPVGVVWFGAVGAVISSFRGIYFFNQSWNTSYNIWHYTRPVIGAVTGSIGALMYWVLLTLGSTSTVIVRPATFYVAAFVLGFADQAFTELLQKVTNVIINPGKSQ